MRTLPYSCTPEAIRELVVEWWELLAVGKYREAFDMFAHDDWEVPWSPEKLEEAIATYGFSSDPDHPDPKWEAGSIAAQPDPQEVIDRIKVDRENDYGEDPAQYNGMVHFFDVPLKQEESTMTARFKIKRMGEDALTLEFVDIHVM